MDKRKSTAIVLAAGQGKRMHSSVQKQYLLLKEKPVLYYALQTFEQAPEIDEVVLVAGVGEIPYCRREIVEKYGFLKVKTIVEGGKERYDSVFCGLRAIQDCDYVYIHDGARPLIDGKMITALQAAVEEDGACVAGMPVKDTIKIADAGGFVRETPDRSSVWLVQTPQVFAFPLVRDAYVKYMRQKEMSATDDAMVVEQMSGHKVRLVPCGYRNIKITTPEDLLIAEALLGENENENGKKCGKAVDRTGN